MAEKKGFVGTKLKEIGKRLSRKRTRNEAISTEKPKVARISEEAERNVRKLSEELGPRPSGSEESRRAAGRIAAEFEKLGFEAVQTEVKIAPHVWDNYAILAASFSLAVMIPLLLSFPIASVVIAAAFAGPFFRDLITGRGGFKRFFRSGTGVNVHAKMEPTENKRSTVIFSAHHDSARACKCARGYILGGLSFVLSVLFTVLSALMEFLEGTLFSVGFSGGLTLLGFLIVFVTAILGIQSVMKMKGAPYTSGAGDNLSGVSVVLGIAEYFSVMGPLKNTEIIFASFDGEECGSQGADAWYLNEEENLVNPVNLNIDGLFDEDNLVFLVSDGNGFMRLSGYAASKCSRIAEVMGYSIPIGRMGPLGGMTDAASAAKHGVEATTITAMPPGVRTFAHTLEDTADKVSREALYRTLSVSIKLAEVIDKDESRAESGGASLLSGVGKYRITKY